jgi:RimJ/RimL family protein N-acetyltransferase
VSPANADEQPVLNIIGDKVALGPWRRDLLPLRLRWVNDFGTVRTYGVPRPTSAEAFLAEWDELVASDRDIFFTLYERATLRPIGHAGLTGIDRRNRYAELDLFIGEPSARGQGYGSETARLLLDYGFTALGLNSISLTVHEYNLAGQRAYEKAGFRETGRRRQRHWLNGRFWDVIYMDCLAEEFSSSVLGRILVPDEPRVRRSQDGEAIT